MSGKKESIQIREALEQEAGSGRTEQAAENKNIAAAHIQAEKDIVKDPDLKPSHRKEDDLDEGETARIGGDKNELA